MAYTIFQSLLVDHIWMLLLLQKIFSEVLILMLLYSVVDHLHGNFHQNSAQKLTFKLSFIVVFFWIVHNKKLFRRSSVSYRTFSEGPTWSDLFPLCSQKKWKAVVNCPNIVAYLVKILTSLVCITPVKSNIPKVWNRNCWTLFGSEIEVGCHGPLAPSGYASGASR